MRKSLKIVLVDVSRAHFNAKSETPTYVKLLVEMNFEGRCGRLTYNLYGTRIAASA